MLALFSLFLVVLPVRGHTYMQHPIPYASQLRDNFPMNKDGSNWPCNGEKEYDPKGVMNVWERGSTQYLQAMGGASHGGGSCQISFTRDLKPSIHSEWRVIHSIHGGCPIRNLTETNYGDSATTLLPSIYNFTIPDWLPIGQGVMAWTWYGRWSVPEMFMNCAPIMVLGGPTGKDVLDETLDEKFRSAPLMFEANNGNGCWTTNLGNCVQFPDPGESVEVNPECPLDPDNTFTGICGPSRRLALLTPRWGLTSHTLLVGFVLVVTILLAVSLIRVFRGTHKGRDKYEKVVHA
ncbi:hypothetical protein BKA61DRAFT_583088 [Leptodontidium sp. MPI-SDFR-AT-0119]|nr:hypothetical protein BKA61DRAFT_583088 [Leptodontidium sp. MPI-SDFR-AT-0119]